MSAGAILFAVRRRCLECLVSFRMSSFECCTFSKLTRTQHSILGCQLVALPDVHSVQNEFKWGRTMSCLINHFRLFCLTIVKTLSSCRNPFHINVINFRFTHDLFSTWNPIYSWQEYICTHFSTGTYLKIFGDKPQDLTFAGDVQPLTGGISVWAHPICKGKTLLFPILWIKKWILPLQINFMALHWI